MDKNNNNKKRIKTKKQIKILTKQKSKLIKNLNKRWKLELKIKIKIKRVEGPNWNQKMRYFKIPLCRSFVRKVGDYSRPKDTCQCYLWSKNRV